MKCKMPGYVSLQLKRHLVPKNCETLTPDCLHWYVMREEHREKYAVRPNHREALEELCRVLKNLLSTWFMECGRKKWTELSSWSTKSVE
jgi:hypothetical protein